MESPSFPQLQSIQSSEPLKIEDTYSEEELRVIGHL